MQKKPQGLTGQDSTPFPHFPFSLCEALLCFLLWPLKAKSVPRVPSICLPSSLILRFRLSSTQKRNRSWFLKEDPGLVFFPSLARAPGRFLLGHLVQFHEPSGTSIAGEQPIPPEGWDRPRESPWPRGLPNVTKAKVSWPL